MSQSETKEKLIKSAIKLFSEKSYFQTKISDIVKEAGVAQGTFYIYFKSKEDILLAIVKTIVNEILKIIDTYQKRPLPPQEKVWLFSRDIFTLLYFYREIAHIFFFQLFCINEEFKRLYYETSKGIHSFLKDTLKNDIIADVLFGFGEKLLKFDLLLENKPLETTLEKLKDGIYITLNGFQK